MHPVWPFNDTNTAYHEKLSLRRTVESDFRESEDSIKFLRCGRYAWSLAIPVLYSLLISFKYNLILSELFSLFILDPRLIAPFGIKKCVLIHSYVWRPHFKQLFNPDRSKTWFHYISLFMCSIQLTVDNRLSYLFTIPPHNSDILRLLLK